MRKWVTAVIIGVLLPYPISLTLQYLAQLQADTGNILYGYAQSALIFLSYFFLGVFFAALQSLRSTGAARRFRWPEFVLGVILLLLSAVWKLEQATGLISTMGFIAANAILTAIVTFNDGLYLWVAMAGYFMTDAFERVPAQSTAQAVSVTVAAETTSIRRSERRKMAKQANTKSARVKSTRAKSAEQAAAAQPQPAATVAAAQPQPVATVAASQPQPAATVAAAQPQPAATVAAAQPLTPGRPHRRMHAPEPTASKDTSSGT